MRASELQSFFPRDAVVVGERRKSDVWFHSLLLVLALAGSGVLRFYSPAAVRSFFQPLPIGSVNDLALLFAAVLAAMVVHEAGHLLAALAFGFQFMGASLGPVRLQFLHGNWKLTFSLGRLFTASISAAPRQLKHWRGIMIMVVAAGPLATLSSAAAGFYFLQSNSGSNGFATFLVFSLQVNVLLFVLGLIPNGADAWTRNDARLLLILTAKSDAAEEIELSVRLTVLLVAGVRPQDYPPDLMLRIAAWRGRPEAELTFAQALVRWAADSDEPAVADIWDARALQLSEHCDSRLRNHALASSACMDVLFRDDFETARNKFTQVDTGSLFPKCFEYRARAARQIALGHSHRAPAEIIRAQYALPKAVAAYELDRKLLEILHLRALMPARADRRTAGISRAAACGARA